MKLHISLRMRLVLLVVAAVAPLFGLALGKAFVNSYEALSRANDKLQFAASLAVADHREVYEAAHQLLDSIGNAPEIRDGDAASCGRYLGGVKPLFPAYANLGIIGIDGHVRCHGLGSSRSVYMGDRASFREAVARRNFTAGAYGVGLLSGNPILDFALPVFDEGGRVSYVAYASLDLVEMGKSISMTKLLAGSRLTIVDRHGIVLAVKPELLGGVGEMIPGAFLQNAVKKMSSGVHEGVDAEGRAEVVAFQPIVFNNDTPFFVVVSVPRALIVGPIYRQLWLELAALLMVTFLGGWIAWTMGGRVFMQPIREIFKATQSIQNGQLDVRISNQKVGPSREFADITEGFNRMAESLERREQELACELARSHEAYAALAQLQREQSTSYDQLRETQRKLLDAQRLGRIGHFELDLLSQRLSLSDEFYELLGLDAGSFDGHPETFMELIHPEDRAYFAQSQKDSEELDIEYRIVTPAGETRWLHQRGRALTNETGQAVCRTGVVEEITARKKVQLALLQNTELLHRTGEVALIGGWELKLDGQQLTCSEQVMRICDLAPGAELSIEAGINFYPPEARAVFSAAMQAAIDQGTPWDLELPMLTAIGRSIWVRTQGRRVMQDGKATHVTGVVQDITAKRESLANLLLLETSISRLNDIVLITESDPLDKPGPRIVFVNDAFERQTGYRREEVLGQSPRLLQGPKTKRTELDLIRAALKRGEPVRAELINYTKSGDEFWSELDIAPVGNSNGWFTHFVAVSRDITHRKLAEQAIMDSEQRYTALFENAPVPMWVSDDTSGKFLTVNKAAVTNYGYSAKEFLSMTLIDIGSELEQGQKSASLHRRKDASILSVDVFSQPIHYVGQPARFVVALDVTAQVKAEKAVQAYLVTLQRAADAAPAITWHQTLDGIMQEFADQARGVLGAHQAVVSYTQDKDWAKAINAMSMSENYPAHKHRIKSPDGSGIYASVCESNRAIRLTQAELEAHPLWRGFSSQASEQPAMGGWLGVPLIGRSGVNIGLLQLADKYEGEFSLQDEYVAMELAQLASIAIDNALLLREVSELNAGLEQKVAERTAALSRQEALFRALAEEAPQAVWTATPDGSITYMNRTGLALAGGELSDWDGHKWHAAVHPEDLPSVKANWVIAKASQSYFAGIRRLRIKDGSYHTMSYRASPVVDGQGDVIFWVGIDTDITEFKTIEAALRLSNQELEAFSYSVSHDLRSPLNTIDGFSRLLEKRLGGKAGDMDGKVQHYLSRIQFGVAQMAQLIDGLLTLAQVSRTQLLYEPVDLSVIAHGILQVCQAGSPERLVELHIKSDLKAHGDGRLISVVMENLILNAWKFTSQQAHAVIRVDQQFDAAGLSVFSVSDNGAGFDMAYADKLFAPFQRLHAASEYPGTGVGLATVSRVIRRHGGRIWAEAAPGQGATFFFTLPQLAVAV